MKHTVLTGILCLALGFAIGWLSKPGRSEAVAIVSDAPSTSPTAKPAPSTRIVDSPTIPSKVVRPESNNGDDEPKPPFTVSGPSPAMQERFQKMIIEQAKQKTDRKIESRAYKDLARINSVLDLNDDQKNAVCDIVYEEAAKKADQSGGSGSAMAMIMDGHGIDIDVDDIAIGGVSGAVENALDSEGNPSPMSHEDLMKSMREQNQKRIDDQVNRLAPALTPEQTEQYRKHLESKNSGMFHNMIIEGGEDGHTGVFSIETSVGE